jgi:hypothetical protein
MQVKAEEFIDFDQSEEFQKADALVKKHAKMLNTLKDRMKRDKVRKVQIRRGNTMKRISFNVREMLKFDTSSLPDEIRDQYMITSEVWWKQVQIDEIMKPIEEGSVEQSAELGIAKKGIDE